MIPGWNRMGLQGNFKTMMLPDVLQWLDTGQRTGILHVRGTQGVTKRVYFERGAIVFTSSSDPREYLGQFLISRGYISEDQLNKAMETQLKSGIKLGKILIMVGILEESELETVLQLKAEENIFDLFLWEEGDFVFQDQEAIEQDLPRVRLNVMSLVMEGIRRKDEWGRIRRVLPTSRVVMDKDPSREHKDLKPNSLAKRALEQFDGRRSLAEVALDLHTTEFQLAEATFQLFEAGLVFKSGEVVPPEEKTYANIHRLLLEEASKALGDGRFGEAANMYRYLVKMTPLDEEVTRGLALAEEGLSQAYFRDVVPLNTVLELAVPNERLYKEALSPQEGYLASRVNGVWDLASILKVSPLAEREVLRSIQRLLDKGILRPKGKG
jgi:hypothetical protein